MVAEEEGAILTTPRYDSEQDPATPLHTERLTWSVLLARWVGFAKSATGLPDDSAGRRLRESVADIIGLQAVWFALQSLDELEAAEQKLGLDRAGVLIERHAMALHNRWEEKPMPSEINELVADAKKTWHEQRGKFDAVGGSFNL